MPPNGFNPFDLVDEFIKSGFPQKQAESLAKALTEMESKNAASKQDIKELDLKIENVRAELKRDIETVRVELKRDIKELELKIKASQNTQTFQLIGAGAALIAIFKFLPMFLR